MKKIMLSDIKQTKIDGLVQAQESAFIYGQTIALENHTVVSNNQHYIDSTIADKKARHIESEVDELIKRVKQLEANHDYMQWKINRLEVESNRCGTCGFVPRMPGEGHYHYVYDAPMYQNWGNINSNTIMPSYAMGRQEWVDYKW